MVTLIERSGSESRIGKGAASNYGFREAVHVERGPPVRTQRTSSSSSLIPIRKVPPDFLEEVGPYFRDRRVVGVQTAVRMYNAGVNRLTFWQHLEFVCGWTRVFSRAKDRLGSATLGGNGQCVRLSSLQWLGDEPWRPSLTEDLDLSLRLMVAGGRILASAGAHTSRRRQLRDSVSSSGNGAGGCKGIWSPGNMCDRSGGRAHHCGFGSISDLSALTGSLGTRRIRGDRHGGEYSSVDCLGLSIESLGWWYLLAFSSVPITLVALDGEGQRGTHPVLQAHLFCALWAVLDGGRGPEPDHPSGRPVVGENIQVRDYTRQATDRLQARFTPTGRPRLAGSTRGVALAAGVMTLLAVSTILLAGTATVAFDTYSELAIDPSPGPDEVQLLSNAPITLERPVP